ncbi:MAG: hypothetical protein E7Z88_03250 [Cyanobacteria bacterium SIG27]|nr:hypothetical protein [Cyanobacteria bacterium SIG27]
MSINAISSVSLYEYYYQINKDEQKKKESPLVEEMRRYGLVPTDNEQLNIQLLKNAKEAKESQNSPKEIPYSDRPWADLMYQLDIQFNPDPKDDIEDIKEELAKLTLGMDDEELAKEVNDLRNYVENMYLNFQTNNVGNSRYTTTLNAQLNNLAMVNQASLL